MRLTLTKQAEYALRILMWLAASEAAERAAGTAPARHKAAQIAAANEVPPMFATRVLALLQRHGLLLARAGQQGGYTLARAAQDVTLLDVIEAVEGPLVTRECVLRDGLCGDDGHCLLHDAWSTARESLREVLARTTLAAATSQSADVQSQLTRLPALRALALRHHAANGASGAAAAH